MWFYNSAIVIQGILPSWYVFKFFVCFVICVENYTTRGLSKTRWNAVSQLFNRWVTEK